MGFLNLEVRQGGGLQTKQNPEMWSHTESLDTETRVGQEEFQLERQTG